MIKRLVLGLTFSVAAIAPSHAQTKLLFNVFFPPGHTVQEVTRAWAVDVEKATQGRVKIDFAAGNLAPPPQQMSAAASGIFDIALIANPFLESKYPLLEFSMLPWQVARPDAASVALWRVYEKDIAPVKPITDVHVLSMFHLGAGHVYSATDKPINSLQDMKDRKMWALPGTAADTLKLLGISPITSPAVQVSESVSRGVVQGIYGITLESLTDFKAAPYLKTLTLFPRGATSTGFTVFMNKGKWASLSAVDREAITKLSGEAFAQRAGKAAVKAGTDALATMKASGIKTIDASPTFQAELKKAGEAQYTAYYATAAKQGADGKALVKSFETIQDTVLKP